MPVSLGEWRVRIGRFVHSVREYVIRERKEKLLKERIRRLRLLQKRLLEKKEKSEEGGESNPNDLSVKVDNAPNESNIINIDTTNDTHKEESSKSVSTIGDEYTFPLFLSLLLSFSLLLSLIFFFVIDCSILFASYKSFLKWSYWSESSWRIICLMIIFVCSSLAYFVLPYVITKQADLQDNLVLINNENAKTESSNKVNNTPTESNIKENNTPSESTIKKKNTPAESTIKENNTPTESAIGKNYTLSDSRTKEKNDTESAKECNSIQINATIKEINTSFITRDGTLEIKQAKTNTSKRKTIKDNITPTELTIRENSTLPESTIKDNIAPKECHIDTRSAMTDNPSTRKTSKRKTTKGEKTVTESTYKSNTTMTESTIKDNNTQNRSAIKVSITKAESTIKESSTPSSIKDKSPKRKISRSKTAKEKNISTESHIKENNITIGYTIDRKRASTESAIKINNPTATFVNKGGYISTGCTIKNSNARTKSTNNASSESTIKKKNTPTECTIKVHNTTAERIINCNETKTESIIKDRQLKTEFTIKDYNRSGESTMTDTKTPYEPTIKDYNPCIELSTKDNTSAIQCAIKEKNTPFESDIKENKTLSGTPTEDNNNQTMKVNIAQAEYTLRSGIQKVLLDGKHSISGQIPSSLKGTTNDSVMQESTCLPEMILIKAGDVELNPGPFERSATIQEQELVNLAYDVPSSKYSELCIALGVSYNQSKAILDTHHWDFTRSLIAIFCEWKNRQRDGTDCRQDIAAALCGVHLDALGDKMSGGGYLPQEAAPTESEVAEESQPLTKQQVDQCAQDFRTFYRTRLCKIKPDPSDFNSILEFERIYTNLVLLRNEMGTTRKTPLDYAELLTTKVNGEFPQRLMVEGEGGAGKTTFCSKIAWDWAERTKEFEEFDWVLVIPFRNTKEGHTVGDIAKTYLSDSNTVQSRQIDNYIMSAPFKVFIIFDGLDEYEGDILKESSDIAKILRSEKYVGCRVLVTTRPWRAVPFKSHKTIRQTFAFLAIAGFDRENISTYITKYFQDEPLAGYELIKYIESNDLIQENMAPFPLFIAMFCIWWRNSDADKRNIIRQLKTFSQLFTAVIISLKDHCLTKQHQNPNVKNLTKKEMNNYLSQIGKFAYSGVLKKRLMYTETDFGGYHEAFEACCRIGVLSREILTVPRQDRRMSEADPVTWSIFFPHKLFQEYLAGMYLASLFESDHERYEQAMNVVIQRAEEFRYLLYFTASQTKYIAIDVTHRLINIGHYRNILVDVTFEAYDEDTAKVVGQHLFAKQKSLKIDDEMSAHTVTGYIFIMEQLTMDTLILSRRSYGSTVSRDLADVICSSTALTSLELSGTAFHDDFYSILESKVKTSKIEKVCIQGCDLRGNDPTASRDLVRFLCLLPCLMDLTIKDSDDEFQHLCRHEDFYHELARQASSSKIEKVCIQGCDLRGNDPTASRDLARFLCLLPCLMDLTIKDSDDEFQHLYLHDDFYHELARQASSSKIEKVCIEGCDQRRNDPTASRDLARFLFLLPCLIDLTIKDCDDKSQHLYFNDEFYHKLALQASSSKIEKVCIDGCDLRENDPTASRDLARFLCLLPCLIDLTIKDCGDEFQHLYFHDDFYHELARYASSSKIQNVRMESWCLDNNDPMAPRNLANFLCVLPCLTDLTIQDSLGPPSWFPEDFYREIALKGPPSMNHFFNEKLHFDKRSEELRQMGLRQQREYIRHLLHPTLSDITPRPTIKAPQPPLVTPPDVDVSTTSGISAQSEKIAEVPADINIQEEIRDGEAPWNRSRIMVIGPAGVGKTSLIRRLTGQEFNLDEQSTKGAEQNVVTQSAVSGWVIPKQAQTAKDVIIQSLAMGTNFGIIRPRSTRGEANRSGDLALTETKGVELKHDLETLVDSVSKVAGRLNSTGTTNVESPHTLDTPSTPSQQQMTEENVTSTPEHRHIAESDVGHVEELTESERLQNTDSNESTLGKGNKSEAAEDKSSVQVLPTIAKISQGITREEITKVKSSALNITYSIWDFGGQEIYYITHPLFLSWRSLYILVIPLHLELSDNAPREEDDQEQLKGSAVRTHRTILELIHFWLMSVYTHAVPDSNLDSAYEPKVLLIGTFAGKGGPVMNEEKVTAKFQELKDRLGSNPYWKQVLSPMFGIDNQFSEDSEVNTIQDRIDGLIQDSEYMKVRKPTKWRTFLTEIEDSDQNSLTVTEARPTMERLGINKDKVDDVLKFYHDIGHLIYHQGCELIVLKPQFLNSIVSNIITVIDDKKMEGDLREYWRNLKGKGVLSIELIKAVWKEQKGDHDQLDYIIDMMIKFDLICEIPDMSGVGRRFFVPCRCSPMLHEKEIHKKDHTVEFTIDFHHFLPDGFLHRFYVRMAKWSMEKKKHIEPTFHCRQMVFFVDNHHRVEMTNEINSKECHQIKVMVHAVVPRGASSKGIKARVSLNENIIDYLHETLEDLKKLWARRMKYSVGILCPNCSEHGDKELVPIRDILEDQDEYASCNDGCVIDVSYILKAFNKGIQLPSEKQEDSSNSVHEDAANLSSVTGNTLGQKNIIKPSRYSHGSQDDSLGEPSTSTKRDKKTNPKTDSNTDEDTRTRRDKRTMSDGSEDDSLDGRPRKRKKKTDRRTDSGDEDGRSRGDKRTFEHVHLGISEMELHDLAEKLGNHTNLRKFALKLGFSYERWMQFKASNTRRDGRICSEGTFGMLIDWKNDTLQVSQKELLNEALIFAGFAEFAEAKHQMEN